MGTIADLTPINLISERQKFLAEPSANPQFQYVRSFTQAELSTYGKTEKNITLLAKEILAKSFSEHSEQQLFETEGKPLAQSDVDEAINNYLELYHLKERYTINWSTQYLVRTMINANQISLRLPCNFREEGLLGMLHHEIGTHALRRINNEQQCWYKQKKRYGFRPYLATEEGLGSLHSLLAHSFRLNYIDAIRYLAVSVASEGSFLDVWNAISPFVSDLDRRWMICVRSKRGIDDTSLPGGYSKDLVYLRGSVEVWQWLQNNHYDLSSLYYGKISAQDVPLAHELSQYYSPIVPLFFSDNPEQYAQSIEAIGLKNLYQQIDLE